METRVAAAARAAGRDPAEVRVLVATKYVAAEHLGALRDAGIRLIGENRAQDLVAKHEAVRRRLRLPLHRPPAEPQDQAGAAGRESHPLGRQPERRAGDRGAGRERHRRTARGQHRWGGEQERCAARRGRRVSRPGGGFGQGPVHRADVHAAALRRRRGSAPLLRTGARARATAFGTVERHVYFRTAIDGYQRRLRSGRPRRGDHRPGRECALLTRRGGT